MIFKPYNISKTGIHSYQFKSQKDGVRKTKAFRYSYKPTQKQLNYDYQIWQKSLSGYLHHKDKKTSNDLFEIYLNSKEEKYKKNNRFATKKITPFLLKYKDVTEIKKRDCLAFFEQLKSGNIKDTSAKRIHAVFSAFLSWCAMMDYIEYNPSLRLQFNVKENKRMGVLNHEQKKEILEESKVFPHLHLAILIAMMTGLRRGEILSLQWSWVDFHHGTLRIPPEHTKNKKGFYIALSSKLLEILKQEREAKPKSTYVVEHGGKSYEYNFTYFWGRLKKLLSFKHLNNEENLTFHHLRHTFATELAQSGLPLVEVKNALNHSDIQTTLRYAHSTGKGVVEAIDKINQDLI